MSELRVASRYAKALIDHHVANNTLDKGYSDMKDFNDTLNKHHNYDKFIKSPIIHGEKKVAVMKAVFEKHYTPATMAFFLLIIKKRREYYLHAVAKSFIEQYNEIKNIGTAEVRSAIALDAKTNDEIRKFIQQLTGKTIEVTNKVDEKLIGGVVIKTGDKLYDASISGNLKKAKQELLNTYISK